MQPESVFKYRKASYVYKVLLRANNTIAVIRYHIFVENKIYDVFMLTFRCNISNPYCFIIG